MKFVLFSFMFILAACSSISKEECVKGDWHNLGFNDAMKGRTEYRDGAYKKDCSEHGVNVDSKTYRAGFEQGLESYCTYNRGYSLGLDGKSEHFLCLKKNQEFSKGYNKGIKEYKLKLAKEQAIKDLKQRLITNYGTKECNTSSDCTSQQTATGKCQYGSCVPGGMTCNFDNDCQVVLQTTAKACVPLTDRTTYGDNVMVHVCSR